MVSLPKNNLVECFHRIRLLPFQFKVPRLKIWHWLMWSYFCNRHLMWGVCLANFFFFIRSLRFWSAIVCKHMETTQAFSFIIEMTWYKWLSCSCRKHSLQPSSWPFCPFISKCDRYHFLTRQRQIMDHEIEPTIYIWFSRNEVKKLTSVPDIVTPLRHNNRPFLDTVWKIKLLCHSLYEQSSN